MTAAELFELLAALRGAGVPHTPAQVLAYTEDERAELAGWCDAIAAIRQAKGAALDVADLPAPPEFVTPATSAQGDGSGE